MANSVTKANLASLQSLSDRVEINFSQTIATMRRMLDADMAATAKSMSKIPPFNDPRAPEQQILLMINRSRQVPRDENAPKAGMRSLFFDEERRCIDQHNLPFYMGARDGKVHCLDNVLETLEKLKLAERYKFTGDEYRSLIRMVELTPLGKRLAEAIIEAKNAERRRMLRV